MTGNGYSYRTLGEDFGRARVGRLVGTTLPPDAGTARRHTQLVRRELDEAEFREMLIEEGRISRPVPIPCDGRYSLSR